MMMKTIEWILDSMTGKRQTTARLSTLRSTFIIKNLNQFSSQERERVLGIRHFLSGIQNDRSRLCFNFQPGITSLYISQHRHLWREQDQGGWCSSSFLIHLHITLSSIIRTRFIFILFYYFFLLYKYSIFITFNSDS